MQTLRSKTKKIKIGNIEIGGNNDVIIQSMCDIKTSNCHEVIKQINECAALGAQMMRVSITDFDDVNAIPLIKQNIKIPLIGDIHYSSIFAIRAIENGIDKIRINPINTSKKDLLKIIEAAKKYDIAIRIGINEGSINSKGRVFKSENDLIEICKETIKLFEDNNFYKIVISIKSSSPLKSVKIYEKLSKITEYPLHIGITESGLDDIGIIRSCVGLVPILNKGIGNTIRISLTKNPKLEILTCKRLLHELGLYNEYPTIISCPTCGRCKVDNLNEIVSEITNYLEKNHINIKISIMGCIVNGIGEAKDTDIGVAGQNDSFIIFSKGKELKKTTRNNLINDLKKEIDSL